MIATPDALGHRHDIDPAPCGENRDRRRLRSNRREIEMNWNRIEGKLKQAKDKMKTIFAMKLFTGLKKIREFERLQLPFLKSLVDFDIVVDIGYAEEREQPLTLKQLFLLNLSSRTTVRRKLTRLIEQGIVIRRKHANDHRASFLIISPSTVKLLGKYGGTLTSISTLHFK
jgi:DNA-binding MarR family transcriptional regulator